MQLQFSNSTSRILIHKNSLVNTQSSVYRAFVTALYAEGKEENGLNAHQQGPLVKLIAAESQAGVLCGHSKEQSCMRHTEQSPDMLCRGRESEQCT